MQDTVQYFICSKITFTAKHMFLRQHLLTKSLQTLKVNTGRLNTNQSLCPSCSVTIEHYPSFNCSLWKQLFHLLESPDDLHNISVWLFEGKRRKSCCLLYRVPGVIHKRLCLFASFCLYVYFLRITPEGVVQVLGKNDAKHHVLRDLVPLFQKHSIMAMMKYKMLLPYHLI